MASFCPVNPISSCLKSLHPKNGQFALIPGSGCGPISLGIGGPGPSWAGGAQFTPWSLTDRRQGPWDRETERQREKEGLESWEKAPPPLLSADVRMWKFCRQAFIQVNSVIVACLYVHLICTNVVKFP
jgi:hypothetical protein